MSARFTRIGLVGRFEDARVADSMDAFARALLARGLQVVVHERSGPGPLPDGVLRVPDAGFADAVDLLVAIGGDGTMLYAAQLVVGRPVPLLGINRGRLGFLADVSPNEMTASFDAVLEGQYEQDVRSLLAATLTSPGESPRTCRALNDIVIQRYETGRMIELATWIDGAFVNTHGGDGLVIASSTGSTAYALSCGGPILHPHLDAVVIAPISPHTLSDRPIVVRRDSQIEVRLNGRATSRAQVTYDGAVLGDLEPESRLVVGPARETVTLLHPHGHDYYRILRSKLHWGRSARDTEPPA
jgi:NAD+ kinase